MTTSSRIKTASERKPVHPDTIRGFARQISSHCVNREVISQLGGYARPNEKQFSSKKERLNIVRKISMRVKASVCAHRVHPQASRADWLVFASDGDGAIDMVHILLSLKPAKTMELSSLTVSSFSKHSVERLVERWHIRKLAELMSTIEPTFGWLQQADYFLPPNGMLLPLPLPDGLLFLRKNALGQAPVIVTAIDHESFSQESEMQWRGLSNDGAMFNHSPDLFKDPGKLPMKHFTKLLVMGVYGMASDILGELRQLTSVNSVKKRTSKEPAQRRVLRAI